MFFKLSKKMKGIEKEYKAILELSRPIFWKDQEKEKEYNEDTFQQMLNELNDMEIQMLINKMETKAQIEVKEDNNKIFLYVTMRINRKEYVTELEEKCKENGDSEEIIEMVHTILMAEEFEEQLQHFRIAVNISYPGLLEVQKTEIYVNGECVYTSNGELSTLLIAVTEARRDNWPKIVTINIEKTWNWLKQRTGFMQGMSTNAIERALSAFSYIYDYYSYEDLFYAMIGNEAIYVRNKEGILQQIKEKTRAIFGEPKDYMKRLKHMYNVRSRFIHGELNFPPRYCREGDTEEFIEFADAQYFDSKNLAQAILVASIQQYVLRNVNELEFELKVKE